MNALDQLEENMKAAKRLLAEAEQARTDAFESYMNAANMFSTAVEKELAQFKQHSVWQTDDATQVYGADEKRLLAHRLGIRLR